MKIFTYCSLFVLVTLLSLPVTADAFGRRSHGSEVGQTQTTPLNKTTGTGDVSAQAVPEPPVYLLMSVGIGLLGLYSIAKRFRRSNTASR